MEHHHAINGKTMETHYFDWAIFNSYVSHYQRACGPNGPPKGNIILEELDM